MMNAKLITRTRTVKLISRLNEATAGGYSFI